MGAAAPIPVPMERNVDSSVRPSGSSVMTEASEPNGTFMPVYIMPNRIYVQ